LTQIRCRVEPFDLFVADRNFCTRGLSLALAPPAPPSSCGSIAARAVPVLGRLQRCGETKTGVATSSRCKRPIRTGACLPLRRIEVRLFTKTRDGERTMRC